MKRSVRIVHPVTKRNPYIVLTEGDLLKFTGYRRELETWRFTGQWSKDGCYTFEMTEDVPGYDCPRCPKLMGFWRFQVIESFMTHGIVGQAGPANLNPKPKAIGRIKAMQA